ncbi:major pollen allergen Ole e 6-like [Ipomoea triloba]|uniref:major pollen allergen Ole e 6-like n=1 Tax=Ipomoea triloba TaxID=35885 RepID=UPI00125E167B|nr:major pollen allergen Ole e 6-like [Ipomoea triloba]
MAVAQKFVAVFLVSMFVLVVHTDASVSPVYRKCFDSCFPACISKAKDTKDIIRCEKGCDIDCAVKDFKAKLNAIKARSGSNKHKQ